MDKRQAARFDKVFAVSITSPAFGECRGIGRNISAGGMFVELAEPLPLGSPVQVHFSMPDAPGEITARGEVRRHYFMNFVEHDEPRRITGMGVRFTSFDDSAESLLGHGLQRLRTLH